MHSLCEPAPFVKAKANTSWYAYRYRPCETVYAETESYYLNYQPESLQNRLSLHIPELGLFVVSDTVHCAIFSITVVRDNKDKRDIYGFRREFILPLDSEISSTTQSWICGIAAGPVQGQMDRTSADGEVDDEWDGYVQNPRLWRLFICTVKGHVHTYELSRAKRDADPPGSELLI